ncbi:MAG: T9SS type A sorting domain-containing protein [Methanobrevibacter sp.]|uniref:T9SS type A sorting domain-containing protein n=1 Tax=Methanobrevibacter sp. TaxID=66852 RepID=UPI001B46E977|nr:T9SS type A sorting domain-containing protein [Methanobrevibacter sp.]MBP3227092.1 T9SS type A sorting domain-containing protein [Methanobrevibacter sp.]MBP3791652.1 T9SS type A sorting domain-containing protein [Methanobrevibacter sp.]
MENKNIIVILIAIIVVLAVVAGALFLQSANAKEPTKLQITSDKSQYEGGELSIKLTDLNKTSLSKEKVNVTITNNKGKVVVNKTVKTNSKGNAKLDLDLKKGKYVVNVTYGGNDNYTGDVDSQNLTIKDKPTTNTLSSTTNEYPLYNSDLGYYKPTGIGQDEMGVVELASGRYVVVAGDGYYEYGGQDSQGNIVTGSFLGHGGSRIS